MQLDDDDDDEFLSFRFCCYCCRAFEVGVVS